MKSERKVTFSSKLNEIMELRSVNNVELAGAIGVSHVSVGKYRGGESLPDAGIAVEIARFFDTPVEVFFGEETLLTSFRTRLNEEFLALFARTGVKAVDAARKLQVTEEQLDRYLHGKTQVSVGFLRYAKTIFHDTAPFPEEPPVHVQTFSRGGDLRPVDLQKLTLSELEKLTTEMDVFVRPKVTTPAPVNVALNERPTNLTRDVSEAVASTEAAEKAADQSPEYTRKRGAGAPTVRKRKPSDAS